MTTVGDLKKQLSQYDDNVKIYTKIAGLTMAIKAPELKVAFLNVIVNDNPHGLFKTIGAYSYIGNPNEDNLILILE